MSLGPFPKGDPAGMRELANWISRRGEKIAERGDDLGDITINIPLIGGTLEQALEDAAARIDGTLGGVSCTLEGIAADLRQEADELQVAQNRWKRARDRQRERGEP